MRKFFLLVCLLTLFACGAGDQEAESTVSMGSPDGYAVACATNYTRAAPHFCRTAAISNTVVSWTQATACTQRVLTGVPANTVALVSLPWRALSNNAVGGRVNTIQLYNAAGCVSASLGSYTFRSYEYVATVAGTTIHEGYITTTIPLDSSSAFYTVQSNIGGNGNAQLVNITILGYYD